VGDEVTDQWAGRHISVGHCLLATFAFLSCQICLKKGLLQRLRMHLLAVRVVVVVLATVVVFWD
jgi:hypothetical protein